MVGKGGKGLLAGKTPAGATTNKGKDKKTPVSPSADFPIDRFVNTEDDTLTLVDRKSGSIEARS